MIGWVLFGAMVIWHYFSLRHGIDKRIRLMTYALLLLLEDETRSAHRGKFVQWIRDSGASNATELDHRAHQVMQTMADDIYERSLLPVHALLWSFRGES